MTRIAGIYKIVNPTGRVYIGQTIDFNGRMKQYKKSCSSSQTYIYNSIRKHGFDSHGVDLIHPLPNDIERKVLDQLEQIYISQYKDCGSKMMNLTSGGLSCVFSESSRAKMSLVRKNKKRKPHSEETKEKIRLGNKGIKRTPEQIQNNRLSKLGVKKDEQFKKQRREYMIGRKTALGNKLTEEHKQAISERFRGEGTKLSKLKDEDVIHIKKQFADGVSVKDVNAQYPQVIKQNLYHIKSGRTWKHLTYHLQPILQ
jgi:group I intron endonuclease